jgi:hypothetical protein
MNKEWIVWLLLALLLIAGMATGCRSAGPKENCAGGITADGEQEFQLCTDKAEYQYGEAVHIRFTITNLSEQPLEYNGGSEAVMEICEREVCQSDEQELTPELTRLVLEPGESRTIEWTWPPSKAYLDEWLGKAPYGSLPILFRGTHMLRPGTRSGAVTIEILYHRER